MKQHKDPLKVFISYSRKNIVVADALADDLKARGFTVIIDHRDLPYGEEWQAELADFIRTSDTVTWLVSQASVSSRWVKWELGEVQRLHKRLIPIAIEKVAPEELPEAIGKIHLLPADGVFSRAVHLDALIKALETDRAWIKEHSRLGIQARKWISSGKDSDHLLVKSALRDAEAWQSRAPAVGPMPSQNILQLIAASEFGEKRRQRRWLVGSTIIALVALVLAGFAFFQQQEAKKQRDIALNNLSRSLGANANNAIDRLNGPEAAQYALASCAAGGSDLKWCNAVLARTVAHIGPLLDNPSKTLVWQGASQPESVELLSSKTGQRTVAQVSVDSGNGSVKLVGHSAEIRSVAIDEVRGFIATASRDQTVRIWNLNSGMPIAILQGHSESVTAVAFSPNGTILATGSHDKSVRLWDTRYWSEITRLLGQSNTIVGLAFSSDGQYLASETLGPDDNRIVTWKLPMGVVSKQSLAGSSLRIKFSPGNFSECTQVSGKYSDGIVEIAVCAEKITVTNLTIEKSKSYQFGSTFGPYAHSLELATEVPLFLIADPFSVRVYDALKLESEPIAEISGELILGATFSPDGTKILVNAADDSLRIWDVATGLDLFVIDEAKGRRKDFTRAVFSSDGSRLIATTSDGIIREWDIGWWMRPPEKLKVFLCHMLGATDIDSDSFEHVAEWWSACPDYSIPH